MVQLVNNDCWQRRILAWQEDAAGIENAPDGQSVAIPYAWGWIPATPVCACVVTEGQVCCRAPKVAEAEQG